MSDPIDPQAPPSVLMVDDTPANLELLSAMLKRRGCKVRAAVNGKLALQAARNEPPDLILLDINMPGMNGYEVCAQLKSDARLKDIPVIFLSALSEPLDKVKAFSAGGVDYITKPFHFEEVEARLETHLALRRQKLQLQENFDKLHELEGLRDSLVHMIVHDLRSPLTVISIYLGLLKTDARSRLSAEAVAHIAETIKVSKKMIAMVSDVLDASKMEAGKMRLKPEGCDLGRLVGQVIAELASLRERCEIRFAAPASPVTVQADREIISRVLQNLLANALKFTKEGGFILLGVELAGDRVRVTVKDDGPGIAPAYQQKIFEKFAQVQLRADHQRYSTGLGLTFCKLAVEAHHGAIGVDSQEGKGSSFWFELPVDGPGPSSGLPAQGDAEDLVRPPEPHARPPGA